jgi:hypothetical protein
MKRLLNSGLVFSLILASDKNIPLPIIHSPSTQQNFSRNSKDTSHAGDTTPINIGIKFDINSDLIKILKSFSTNAPETSKALTVFTQEVTSSAKKLFTHFITTIQSVDSDMASLGVECMSSAQEIVNGLKDVIKTLTKTPEKALEQGEKSHLKATAQHILHHATLITSKTAAHLGKSAEQPTIPKELHPTLSTK